MKPIVFVVSLVSLQGSSAAARQGGILLRTGREQVAAQDAIADAADFMETRETAKATTARTTIADGDVPMPTVSHKKTAGDGYSETSPLYEKQEAIRKFLETVEAEEESIQSSLLASARQHWTTLLTSGLVYIILVLIVAALYRTNKSELRDAEIPSTEGDTFSFAFFDCIRLKYDFLYMCLLACCCPAIRWADTVSAVKVGIMSFWPALILALALSVLGPLTGGVTLIAFAILGVAVRQRLRVYFDHAPHQPKTLFLDCMAWCCCFQCCALVQEAREVEYVRRKQ
jgi:Cys-rich protein (TIGR01571 family)